MIKLSKLLLLFYALYLNKLEAQHVLLFIVSGLTFGLEMLLFDIYIKVYRIK